MLDSTKHFWESHYKQNIAHLIGICYRYTHDRQIAEDLAHDAFLLAIDKSASFENKGHFNAWLQRIVVNVALQYLRDQKKHKNHEEKIAYYTEVIEIQEEKQGSEDSDFTKAELLEAIRLLPEHHRLVFNLYVMDRFTHAQIAAELGISEGTSKSHLARARKKIKEILTRQLKEKKQRRPAFLLYLFPIKLWDIDRFFTRSFNDFGLQTQQSFSLEGFDLDNAAIIPLKPSTFASAIYLKTGVAILGLTFGSTFFNQPIQAPALSPSQVYDSPSSSFTDTDLKKDSITKISSTNLNTATFSKNDIIPVENNKIMEKMKNLKTLGAVLMLSSALTLDTSSLLESFELPLVVKKQPMVESAKLDLPKPAEIRQLDAKTKRNSPPLSGTFYASSLTWESPKNALILKGNRVKVNLNTQKFNGDGTFCFVDHVDYIAVDGVVMKLNEPVKLSDKKYSLTELDERQSTKKYGEHVKKAIEIALAE